MDPSAPEQLVDVVLAMAEADDGLSADAELVVLAALEGADVLTEVLDSANAKKTKGREATRTEKAPVGAFLDAIEVAGFRGIGPIARLALHPGPGLTVVSGRNGSGKSSFSEAFEYAVTGDCYRWRDKKSSQWHSNWQNLHQKAPCQIRVKLAVEGAEPTTIGIDWGPGATLDQRTRWVQIGKGKRSDGIGVLGWGAAVELHRPILSYDELGGLLAEAPSTLHDALARLLGLEQISDAEKLLAEELKSRRLPRLQATASGKAAKALLSDSDDDRAGAALVHLRKKDVDQMSQLVTAGPSGVGRLHQLRRLQSLRIPDADTVEAASTRLALAITNAADLASAAITLTARRNDLLDSVLAIHADHGDMSCPVCGVGTLDSAWRDRAASEVADDKQQLQLMRARGNELDAARRAMNMVIDEVATPNAVDDLAIDALLPYQKAVEAWRALRGAVGASPERIQQQRDNLASTLALLHRQVAVEIAAREDKWAPIAEQLIDWSRHERAAQSQEPTAALVEQAKKWMTANAATLRNQRLEPIAGRAREIWAELRQESNVDLGAITLEGTNTRRRVNLEARVDGQPAGALAVMSQGELHALALALFLPRATTPDSPFRFVILDDPIQAMDPAKVDGFVRVVSNLAKTRQVVVFSHDDRLAAAVRHLGIPARVVEVTRGSRSVIDVVDVADPSKRYVTDARALMLDDKLPDDVKTRVIPGLCRMAVEAAAQQVFSARRHRAGQAREDTEREWLASRTTQQRVALAVHDDRTSDVNGWRVYRAHRKATLAICGGGVHGRGSALTMDDVRDLDKTVSDLLDLAR